MVTLYIYDISAKDKKRFNKIKRNFYYHLNKILENIEGNDVYLISKSVLVVENKFLENSFDLLFRKFIKDVKCFKVDVNNIEQISM